MKHVELLDEQHVRIHRTFQAPKKYPYNQL